MDSGQIPQLILPSGGTVEFVDIDDLTGDDLAAIRRVIRTEDSAGETTNVMYQEAMRVGIKAWNIPYLTDPHIPAVNPAAWKKLKARDLQAVEKALQPVTRLTRPLDASVDDQTPGSPTQPASD